MRFLIGSGRACLDFTRTVQRRSGAAIDLLDGPPALLSWATAAGITPMPPAWTISASDLHAARTLREAIYRAVTDRIRGTPVRPEDVGVINACAEAAVPVPQLEPDTHSVAWTAARPSRALLSFIARDAIDLLVSDSIHRVRECADPDCTSLFLDTSRPGTRRWCSAMPCANRHKVRAHRARKSARHDHDDESR